MRAMQDAHELHVIADYVDDDICCTRDDQFSSFRHSPGSARARKIAKPLDLAFYVVPHVQRCGRVVFGDMIYDPIKVSSVGLAPDKAHAVSGHLS